jgi:hypothetical protein
LLLFRKQARESSKNGVVGSTGIKMPMAPNIKVIDPIIKHKTFTANLSL